jgi:hypothetical protein
MLDKDSYYLKKMKTQLMRIYLLAAKSEDLALKSLTTGADLSAAEPLSVIDSSLRDLHLYVPPAFFDEWRAEAPGALRRFLRGEAPSALLLDELFA